MSSYATIDEAFGKDSNKQKKKSKKIKQPLCDYYANRYANIAKESKSGVIESNDNLDIYSVFDKNDEKCDFLATNSKFLKKNRKKSDTVVLNKESEADYFDRLYACYDFKPLTNTDGDNLMNYASDQDNYYKEDEEDLNKKAIINRGIKTLVDDEDEFNYNLSDDEIIDPSKKTDNLQRKVKKSVKDEEVGEGVNEVNEKVNERVNEVQRSKKSISKDDYEPDKNYMDFGLYLISGILLIFILEQFIQVGLMIRNKRDVINNNSFGNNINQINSLNPIELQYNTNNSIPRLVEPRYQIYTADLYSNSRI